MKFHNGKKRINKVDGGKKKAKRQYHKKIRSAGNEEISDNMPMTEVVGRAVKSLVENQMKQKEQDIVEKEEFYKKLKF